MSTHSSKTILNSINVYRNRAKNEDLIWCKQILDLILNYSFSNDSIGLADIGCNYFQLWKEIKRRNLEEKFKYIGYDLDLTFINLGLEFFPELSNRFKIVDIEKNEINKSQVVVCSAVFEHLDNPEKALDNILNSTKQLLILRTFLGEKEILEVQDDKRIINQPYNINQFSMFTLTNQLLNKGFKVQIICDEATKNSSVKKVSGQIERQMYILFCEKLI